MTNAYAIDDVILKSETTFNPSHENRFSLMFGVNPSLQNQVMLLIFFSLMEKNKKTSG